MQEARPSVRPAAHRCCRRPSATLRLLRHLLPRFPPCCPDRSCRRCPCRLLSRRHRHLRLAARRPRIRRRCRLKQHFPTIRRRRRRLMRPPIRPILLILTLILIPTLSSRLTRHIRNSRSRIPMRLFHPAVRSPLRTLRLLRPLTRPTLRSLRTRRCRPGLPTAARLPLTTQAMPLRRSAPFPSAKSADTRWLTASWRARSARRR